MELPEKYEWQIVIEKRAEFWSYAVYRQGDESGPDGIGSADDLKTCLSMANETFEDCVSYWKRHKQKPTTDVVTR